MRPSVELRDAQVHHHYSIYGLHVEVDTPVSGLPLLEAGSSERETSEPDVRVQMGSFPEEAQAALATGEEAWPYRVAAHGADLEDPQVTTSPDGAWICFRYSWGVSAVLDRAGTRLGLTWRPDLDIDDATLFLTGPMLGFIVRLRGGTALHASAVELGGGAHAFVGVSGTGKSTTAYALAARGHAVLADDMLVLRSESGCFEALPAHVRLRVWPDAVTAVEGGDVVRPELARSWGKQYVSLGAPGWRRAAGPLPLEAIYLLQRELGLSDIHLEPVPAPQALPALVAQTYRNEVIPPEVRAQEFQFLADVVAQIPVYRLRYPSALVQLSALCERIESNSDAGGPPPQAPGVDRPA